MLEFADFKFIQDQFPLFIAIIQKKHIALWNKIYLICKLFFRRYGESDDLPVHVRKKLETLPMVMSRLEAAQTSQVARMTNTR